MNKLNRKPFLSNAKHTETAMIRIIGGKWRGRKLPVINSDGLRPTTDRNKETLFNWLMPIIHNANCLDCYSGSGSLGFEAISRGASQVTLLEKNRVVSAQLEKNKQQLNDNNIHIINTNTIDWLSKNEKQLFDIIFIDPPFHQNLVSETAMLLEQNNWLNPTAWIYIETEINNMTLALPKNWQLHREKQSGQVNYQLYIREKS